MIATAWLVPVPEACNKKNYGRRSNKYYPINGHFQRPVGHDRVLDLVVVDRG
jgi:hypothetical protein